MKRRLRVPTTGLAHQGDAAGVAAECGRIGLHPPQQQLLVRDGQVRRSQQTQPIVESYDYGTRGRQAAAFVIGVGAAA